MRMKNSSSRMIEEQLKARMADGDFDFARDITWMLKLYDSGKDIDDIEYDRIQRVFDKAKSIQYLAREVVIKCRKKKCDTDPIL